MEFTYRMIETPGPTLSVAVAGEATGRAKGDLPPLLLLNGIGFNAALMEKLAMGFAGRRIVVPEMPGCGRSPAPSIPYTMGGMARAVVSMMKSLFGDEPFDCLGFSWGGALAQQIAVQAQAPLNRLVLVSTTSGMPLPVSDTEIIVRMLDPREYVDPRRMGRNFSAMLKEGGAGAGLLTRFTAPTPAGVTGQLVALAGWSVLPLLPFVRVPVLIVGTGDDFIVPVAHNRILACAIPQSELFELDSGGHLAPLASPKRVIPRLKRFLSGQAAQEAA